ncbi:MULTISPECIES: DNA recombination protein RmuC [unclassified Oceanobacter]|uniref:DNA recombination protein RmuC n=1 Tax=unclassified Oceanobacter TaxID=2620260 RepID=UPI0027365B98|nr:MULTISPECIES: DNA recombination protein RmuC [unclassified Oceanobacter]MDP2609698.1 DNA recombination protein RmuC [Oceanobacter sp. 1_MG-2023]MDP2613851.1 DNA recombination protein RmuC [Oceanobacter sp. 2_MG-2023]
MDRLTLAALFPFESQMVGSYVLLALSGLISGVLVTALIMRHRSRTAASLMQQQYEQRISLLETELKETGVALHASRTEAARWQERGNAAVMQKQALESERKAAQSLWQNRLADLQQRLSECQTELASERQGRKMQQQHADEKLALLQQNKEQLLQEFEQLSQKIFEQKQQQFTRQSQEGLTSLLTPFREQLDGLRKKVEDVHISDTRDRASLQAQIVELHKLNQHMSAEAHALTTALRGETKTQGNWGEMVLETVLERSGLRKGAEYVREESHQDDSGQRYRPDVIIRLPEGKHIVVDSKVSLNAYTDYINADSELEQAAALKRHIESVRNHVRSLSDKAYQNLNGLNSPDFVFLFMPVEPAFMLAFQHDESLFNTAFEQKIVVVTPTTLLATLRTVASLWAIERRNQSTEKLADQAGKLYDKLVVVVEKFEKVGSQLTTVNKSYDEAWNSLKSGRGNLLSQADSFRKQGVRVKKALAKNLVDDANAEAELHESLATPP